MMQYFLLIVIVIIARSQIYNCSPFGVRLTYGQYFTQQSGVNQLYIAFNTYSYCPGSYVGFGNLQSYSNFSCNVTTVNFTWVTPPYFNSSIYICPITNINFNKIILYSPTGVDPNGILYPYMNKNISTVLVNKNTSQNLKFLVIGDWAYFSPLNQTMFPSITNCLNLLKTYQPTDFQGILFVGDQAYDLNTNNGTNYVEFLTMLQPYSSIWPFMGVPGNHEISSPNNSYLYNLTYPYVYQDTNYFYHFTIGYATFIGFNPNAIVYNMTGNQQILTQILMMLNQTILNSTSSFIIPFSHYPFFCSLSSVSQCTSNNISMYPIQQLFNNLNIKLYLSGHIHNYERQFPTTDSGYSFSTQDQITLYPSAPIYIIQGDGGTTTGMTTTQYPTQPFTAKAQIGTGYGILSLSSLLQLEYFHINASSCSTVDTLSALFGTPPSTYNKFPVWAIILITFFSVSLLLGIAYYIFYSRNANLQLENQHKTITIGIEKNYQVEQIYNKV